MFLTSFLDTDVFGSSKPAERPLPTEREVVFNGTSASSSSRGFFHNKSEVPLSFAAPSTLAHNPIQKPKIRQRSEFLKKRGKMQYDPLQAVKWDKEKRKLEQEERRRVES